VHTNSTIGALLNATFGNAPEFLISSAALRSGFYRVVQLTLLGSILCNLCLVFGLSCLVGGARWQVQEVIMTSGNVSIGMLLIGTAGTLLPALLKLGNQEVFGEGDAGLSFSRFNALVMLVMYFCYLFFQLATHKDEFDEDFEEGGRVDGHKRVVLTRNKWFQYLFSRAKVEPSGAKDAIHPMVAIEMSQLTLHDDPKEEVAPPQSLPPLHSNRTSLNIVRRSNASVAKANLFANLRLHSESEKEDDHEKEALVTKKIGKAHNSDTPPSSSNSLDDDSIQEILSLRAGILWLLAITLCISAISDVIVDTIDGFALKCQLSEIFTSVIIIPFFSNIAEMVSAVLFAYRNKMDLCLGVTVGSAIQISCCVVPGCILFGWFMDKSLTLFFNSYETGCLFLGVLSISAILHGGTTNWLVGVFFIGMYLMFAAGFWFHVLEDLSVDEEIHMHNATAIFNGTGPI